MSCSFSLLHWDFNHFLHISTKRTKNISSPKGSFWFTTQDFKYGSPRRSNDQFCWDWVCLMSQFQLNSTQSVTNWGSWSEELYGQLFLTRTSFLPVIYNQMVEPSNIVLTILSRIFWNIPVLIRIKMVIRSTNICSLLLLSPQIWIYSIYTVDFMQSFLKDNFRVNLG